MSKFYASNQSPEDLKTRFLRAASKSNTEELKSIFADYKMDANPEEHADLIAEALCKVFEGWDKKAACYLASKPLNVNYQDKAGCTLLMLAAGRDNLEVAKQLIEKGADLNHKSTAGKTALQYARYTQKKDLEALLTSKEMKLRDAVTNNNFEMVKQQVAEGADINTLYKCGDTLLHVAAVNGCLDIVDFLIKQNSNINVQNDLGDTPLHLSIKAHQDSISIQLIKAGADLTKKNAAGQTAKMTALRSLNYQSSKELLAQLASIDEMLYHEIESISYRRKPAIPELIKDGANPDAKIEPNDKSARELFYTKQDSFMDEVKMLLWHPEDQLCHAIERGNVDSVKKHLADGVVLDAHKKHEVLLGNTVGVNFDDFDDKDKAKDEKIIKLMINPEDEKSTLNQLLLKAAKHGYTDSVVHLLNCGADRNHKDSNELEPCFTAHAAGFEETALACQTPKFQFSRALTTGNLPSVQEALKNGMKIETRLNGLTPLALAVKDGHDEVVEYLLQNGANPNAKQTIDNYPSFLNDNDSDNDNNDKTKTYPLHICVDNGHLSIMDILIKHKAKIDVQDSNGVTPLMFSIVAQGSEMLTKLINAGANLNKGGKDDTTPLMLAARLGNIPCVTKLVMSGACIGLTDSDNKTANQIALEANLEIVDEAINQAARALADLSIKAHSQAVLNTTGSLPAPILNAQRLLNSRASSRANPISLELSDSDKDDEQLETKQRATSNSL